MTVHELQQEILRLKREKNICILAHAYQSQPVLEVADYTGDSYGLSVQAAKTNADGVIMCGVRFMAETCKILSPEKTVWLANPMAGCPMAEQLDLATLQELKKQYQGYAVVAYINTTSELKTACDVCVTSSSALKICSALENDKILFIPDPNLGSYVAKQLPEKQFAFYHGGCPRHIVCSAADVAKARAAHPEALLLVHPECRPEVVEQADYVGSTTGIMTYAEKSDAKEFIIGTENSIVEHLSYACPEKRFYPLAVQLTCMNMKLTTLMDIYHCLQGSGGEEITLFRNGTLQMAFCWNIAQQLNSDNNDAGLTNSGDEIFPMAFPTESGDPKLCGGIWGFGIFDNGDEAKIEAAKTFIDFIAADPDQVGASVLASTYFPVRESVGDIYAGNDIMSEYTKFMGFLGDYYQITPGWATARTEWWNMLQRVGTGEPVEQAVATFVENANAAATAEA